MSEKMNNAITLGYRKIDGHAKDRLIGWLGSSKYRKFKRWTTTSVVHLLNLLYHTQHSLNIYPVY